MSPQELVLELEEQLYTQASTQLGGPGRPQMGTVVALVQLPIISILRSRVTDEQAWAVISSLLETHPALLRRLKEHFRDQRFPPWPQTHF